MKHYEPMEIKNKKQNLRKFLISLPEEFNIDRKKLASDLYEKDSIEIETYPVFSKISIIRTGYRDPEIMNEYFQKFISGKITPEPYFTEEDGKVYKLTKRFFDSVNSNNENEYEKNLLNVAAYFNTLNCQINNDLNQEYNSSIDRIDAPNIRKAYHTGGCYRKRNPLKEAAWIVTHSYVIDRFMSDNYQYRLIPKDKELIPLWNHYIEAIKDIPDVVKLYYILNKNCESPFTYNFEGKGKNINTTIAIAMDPVMNEHPMDDKESGSVEETVTEEVPFEEAIVNESNVTKSVIEDINNVFHIINKNENVIDAKFEQISSEIKEEKKEEIKNEEKKEKFLQKKIYERPEEADENIRKNNESAEKFVNKLDKFTNLCRSNGYSVYYSNNQWYPNLVQAYVFNRTNPEDKRYILLDPCIIYGDTLRVIHMKEKDELRKGTFVAISQRDLVEKIIKGKFNIEDRKKNMDQLPKVLGDYKDKYIFIDRIDLHNLQELTRKEDGRSIGFNEWKKLIINISNVFKNPEIPICRFRIDQIKDCNHFKLVCDDKVDIFYKSTFAQEESHIKAFQSVFWVDYDIDKYKDSNYIFGTIK